MLETIVAEALAQAAELLDLDGPRAEAWASDLLALADEVGGADAVAELLAALAADPSPAAAAARHAIVAVAPAEAEGVEPGTPAPPWAAALGTSRADGAWVLRARRGTSAAFVFVDADDVRHVVAVDLIPGPPERIGEVTIGPGDLLDGADETDAGIEREEVPAAILAARVAAALAETDRPRETAVVNGRLLVIRLASILGSDTDRHPPRPAPDEVPELPPRDPDDDAYARNVLVRALGTPEAPAEAPVTAAAMTLREAAAADAPLAAWLAASVGPVDLDEPDLDVVLAALAAAVAPASLAPLDPAARDAVLVLEWADWLGAVLGLVRVGEGADVAPMALVDHVNRCPEVTTTIPKRDRDRVAWAFAVCTEPWAPLGLVDDGTLTVFGVAILPFVLLRAWPAPPAP